MKKILAYAILSFFTLAVIINAQPNGKRPFSGRGPAYMKSLNLTPDQEKQMKDIRYQQQKKVIDLQSQIQKNRLELKHMVSNNNIDDKKILDLTDANSKIQADLKNSRVQTWLSIYKILNPQQKEIWAKHFENFGENMRGRMQGMMMRKMDGNNPMMRMQRFNRDHKMGMKGSEDNKEPEMAPKQNEN